ncbi:MAG: M18 family aminopeptidase, partial [Defluviitaleaceae bacterium]|nr:M18 family aminopeptidase [Defluviitaleaceae bacterium]
PLALAGRVLLKGGSFLTPVEKFININKPLVVIPSLAIHLNREVNQGFKINPQSDTLPLAAMVNSELEKDGYLLGLLTLELGCDVGEILDFDLTLYEYAKGELVGREEEFISSPRLDDLWMVWAGLQTIKNASPAPFTQILYCPDNEEIGSLTAHGGESRFLLSIIKRITKENLEVALANTFVISADLGHATNPNYADKDDPTTKSIMGGGVLLKYSAMQKYATNGYTAAVFKGLCEAACVPCQGYITRSDVQGGSTIGAMMAANMGIKVVDMGLAVLGMHSIRELGAVVDNEYVLKLFKAFFSTQI